MNRVHTKVVRQSGCAQIMGDHLSDYVALVYNGFESWYLCINPLMVVKQDIRGELDVFPKDLYSTITVTAKNGIC